MPQPEVAPYGSWKSPISAEQLARGGVGLGELQTDGDAVLWLELRPAEGGRQVICRWEQGTITQLTPDGFNVRTRVHEYGGGAFLVHQGVVWFSNFADQRLYRQDPGPGQLVRPITPETATPATLRYADACATPDGALLVCVRERHQDGEVINELVALPGDGSADPWVIAGGRDFYASPRLSPDGRQLAWLEWDHPNMPWDGTELRVANAEVEGGALRLAAPKLVAGGPDESIFQPSWSADGQLSFVSDRSGWWNLYRLADPGDGAEAELLAPMQAEFGQPQWLFGMTTYALLPDASGRIACVYGRGPVRSLGILAPWSTCPDPIELPYTSFSNLHALGGSLAGKVACVAGSPALAPEVVIIDPDSGAVTVLRRSREVDFDPAYLSTPRPIEFPTEGDLTAHALYYPPANPSFQAPEGERPPLLVTSHGGPTAQASSVLNLGVQFFTSRGFAVVDVDYGGSTGYGRAYRQRLNGQWGIVDMADCANAALSLADQGPADRARLAIRGGSAGGYTTLCVLTFRDDFAAGASYFGVADLAALAQDTHKFESRYLDRLIGPYPEDTEVYQARSPLHHTEGLSCPVILLQGLEDLVVPPVQAERMAAALDAKGIPYAYLPFEGEQHGFRRAENIQRAAEAELYFYSRIFGFELADPVEPVEIHNL
jgi:dipeptidyl aminopeptidase/acylaminoacyl peptidase